MIKPALEEEKPDLICQNSGKDLPFVGRESSLDDWFCAQTSLMEKTKVNKYEPHRCDSGGSEGQRGVPESRLLKKTNVDIQVTAVDIEDQKESVAAINLTNLNANFKSKLTLPSGIRHIKSEAVNLDSKGEINGQLILRKDKTVV